MWGIPRACVESQASPHDAASCFAVESKKDIPSALGRNFKTPWAYDVCAKNPAENWSLEKSSPLSPGKRHHSQATIGRRTVGRLFTTETRTKSTADVADESAAGSAFLRTAKPTNAGRQVPLLKVRKITWACVRARDLPSTPHRSARASGGDSRVEPTTRARAHRVAAKAGEGWPWTRGELRDTRSSDGPTLRVFLNHEQETGRGRSPRR